MRSKERRRCRQSGSRPGRRFLALAAAALGIGACSVPPPTVVLAPTGFVQGFVGGIAADEPRATVVALQTLTGGGTAADGAVALTFALGVTYPAAAGLGGGGVCLVYDGAAGTLESLDFLPRAGAAGGPVAVPGTARGMAALHARYGRVAWEDLVVQAEGLARRGAPVSPALARHLGEAAAALAQDPDLAAMFTGTGGCARGHRVRPGPNRTGGDAGADPRPRGRGLLHRPGGPDSAGRRRGKRRHAQPHRLGRLRASVERYPVARVGRHPHPRRSRGGHGRRSGGPAMGDVGRGRPLRLGGAGGPRPSLRRGFGQGLWGPRQSGRQSPFPVSRPGADGGRLRRRTRAPHRRRRGAAGAADRRRRHRLRGDGSGGWGGGMYPDDGTGVWDAA